MTDSIKRKGIERLPVLGNRLYAGRLEAELQKATRELATRAQSITVESMLGLVTGYRDNRRYDAALALCDIVESIDGTNTSAHYLAGTVNERIGALTEALDLYKSAGRGTSAQEGVRRVEKGIQERVDKAKELRDSKKTDDCITYCTGVLEEDHRNVAVRYFLATAYESKANLEAAKEQFGIILAANPKYTSARAGYDRVEVSLETEKCMKIDK